VRQAVVLNGAQVLDQNTALVAGMVQAGLKNPPARRLLHWGL